MTSYERARRHARQTPAEIDAEIDLLNLRHQQTVDESVRKDCKVKIAILVKLKDELLTPELL